MWCFRLSCNRICPWDLRVPGAISGISQCFFDILTVSNRYYSFIGTLEGIVDYFAYTNQTVMWTMLYFWVSPRASFLSNYFLLLSIIYFSSQLCSGIMVFFRARCAEHAFIYSIYFFYSSLDIHFPHFACVMEMLLNYHDQRLTILGVLVKYGMNLQNFVIFVLFVR